MTITLRQLRYFDALARHGQFGRAAAACAVSQPALSVQIKELETGLGAALFERGPRGVRPTPLGAEMVPRIRDILRAVEDLTDLARAGEGPLSGRLRLGVIPTVAPYLIPRIVAAVGAAHPDLALDIRETVTPTLVQEIEGGGLDAAILALPLGEPELSARTLLTEPFLLVRPAAEADAPVPTPEGLAAMRLLLLEEGHCFRDQALAVCAMRRAPRTGLEGSSLATLVQMVGAGLGVTLVPEMAIAVERRAAPVAISRFPDPAPSRTIGLAWRRSSPLGPALSDLSEVIGRALAPESRPCAPSGAG